MTDANQIFELHKFIMKITSEFDESHNLDHALCVFKNACNIINQLDIHSSVDWDIIEYAAKLHDVRDHKYPNSISEEELKAYISEHLGANKCERVMKIIDNVSFSREVKGQRENLPYPDSLYLDIISDADKLEAIGPKGIGRCKTFVKARGGVIPEDVVAHCHEKLLRLYPEFIRTKSGKEIAEPLHQFVESYVKNKEACLKGIIPGIYKHYKHTSENPRLYHVSGVMRNGQDFDQFAVRYTPLYQSTRFKGTPEFYRNFESFTGNVWGADNVPRFKLLEATTSILHSYI